MDIPFEGIYHLEEFVDEGEERFIKVVDHGARGNAIRWPEKNGRRSYKFFSPETVVARIERVNCVSTDSKG